MADSKEKPEMVALNVRITPDLRRRLLVARANTSKTVAELVTQWIEAGLSKLETNERPPKGKK
jgi:predicted DNA-binding protein